MRNDALNHRVQTVTTGGTTDILFNASGRRVSMWSRGRVGQSKLKICGRFDPSLSMQVLLSASETGSSFAKYRAKARTHPEMFRCGRS
jgi:hypothetical protein